MRKQKQIARTFGTIEELYLGTANALDVTLLDKRFKKKKIPILKT